MGSALSKVLAKMKSGAELQTSDFIRLATRTSADERAELIKFISDVTEKKFTKEHAMNFATHYPILGKEDIIFDHICDVIDQLTGDGYTDLISEYINLKP